MVTKKRFTPEEDFKRLAERIWSNKRGKIIDEKSFNKEFDNYLEESPKARSDKLLRSKVFSELQNHHTSVKYGRKSLVKTRRATIIRYEFTGFVKGKEVKARESRFKIKGKTVLRLRDAKGRFVKRK